MTEQKLRLLNYLIKGRTVDRIKALKELGIIELSSRIVALENDGNKFEKGWTKRTNMFGEQYRLRTYKLKNTK